MKHPQVQRCLFLVLSLAIAFGVDGCTSVLSWNGFKEEVAKAVGSEKALVFCPFRINKPTHDKIRVSHKLSIACRIPKRCILRGEGSHFQVQSEQSTFSLSGFVIRGATLGAIRVFRSSRQTHVIRSCVFRDNDSSGNRVRGGALRLDPGTKVSVISSRFHANQAVRGGAIYHRGTRLTMAGCVLRDNKAKIGGALAVEPGSQVIMTNTRFVGNEATAAPGGAIYVSGTAADVVVGEGMVGAGNSQCNGVVLSNQCNTFSALQSTASYEMGSLDAEEYGIRLSHGLTIRLLAETGKTLDLTSPDGEESKSSLPFHIEPDGAHAFELDDGGWVYISNSEGEQGTGGVYSLEFDPSGRLRNYTQLLNDTTRNCNGGATPWNTWVSCEECPGGQCWQVDPTGQRTSMRTSLGESSGGFFEAFAFAWVENDDGAVRPVFFVTEDTKQGALRRFRPDVDQSLGWNMLHEGGTVDYLEFLPEGQFQWTSSLADGKASAEKYYRNSEGIVYHDGELLFVSKVQKELFRLNLEEGTYEQESTTLDSIPGGGSFEAQPDHLVAAEVDAESLLFFSEDGGTSPGVYVQHGDIYFTLLEAVDDQYKGDETTGLAFSPNGLFFYFCLQENGMLFQVQRSDGRPFENRRLLKWEYGLGRR